MKGVHTSCLIQATYWLQLSHSDDQLESLSGISELDFSMQPLRASTPNSSLSFSYEYSVISSLLRLDMSLLSQSVSEEICDVVDGNNVTGVSNDVVFDCVK